MAHRAPLNATFFALRKREPGGALLTTSVAFAVANLLLIVVFVGAFWLMVGPPTGLSEMLMNLSTGVAGGTSHAPTMSIMPNFGLIILGGLIFALVYLALLAAYESACLRWMIHGERGGVFGLSFGAETWRVYGGYWMWLILILGAYIGTIIVGAILAVVVGLAAANAPAWIRIAGVITAPVVVCMATIYALVRLAPASAASIALRRFSFFSGWRLSKGRFWALFGAFLLLGLVYLLVGLVFAGAYFAAIGTQVDWGLVLADPTAFNADYLDAVMGMWSSPGGIALMASANLASYVVALLFYVLFYGVNARAAVAAIEEGLVEGAPARAAS